MPPPLDAYMVRMKNLHSRYSLPSNVMALFAALGEQQRGYDPDGLGRLMRMSPSMRKACTDTISQLAMVMQRNQDPSTIAECTELIKSCTEMLALANEPVTDKRFPLLKLPLEIRRRVYQHYFHRLLPYKTKIIIPRHINYNCNCQPLDRKQSCPFDIALALTSKAIKEEVMAAFIEAHAFHFGCGCELKSTLSNNISLHANLRSLKIHWNGPQMDIAFRMLKQVPTLKRLTVVISKATTDFLSKREQALKDFFRLRRGMQNRLTDALGFDEILELRGLEFVKVEHINKTQAALRTNEEQHALESCLKARIRK